MLFTSQAINQILIPLTFMILYPADIYAILKTHFNQICSLCTIYLTTAFIDLVIHQSILFYYIYIRFISLQVFRHWQTELMHIQMSLYRYCW